MAYERKYTHEGMPNRTLFLPENGAPFVPQSCYSFGAPAHIEICAAINRATSAIYDAYMKADPSGEKAAFTASDLIDTLITDMGYTRVSTELI